MELAAGGNGVTTVRHPKLVRVGVVLALLLAATATTLTTALVFLSITQPAVVVGVLDRGTIGSLLRVVVVFVASGLARLLHYL